MMINSDGRKRRQLTPEEKWQVFVEVCSQQLTQADAARKWGVDVSTVIRLRRLAKDGALAAFAASKPGRPPSVEQVELEACRVECARLTKTVKEQAIELALLRGKAALGLSGPAPARLSGETKLKLMALVDQAVASGWAHVRACELLGVADVRVHRWRAKLAETGTLDDMPPGRQPRASHPCLTGAGDPRAAPPDRHEWATTAPAIRTRCGPRR